MKIAFSSMLSLNLLLLSKPQLNHNSTQPNITVSWVRHENDFVHDPPLYKWVI